MIPRECDNDDCDYETYVDANGNPQVRWEHDESCDGPVELISGDELRARAKAAPTSFLAWILPPE